MSKIALEGNASGTGTFTLAAPNTNSNYTLNLPTASGTLVTTGGAQTIEFAAGSAAAPSITTTGDTNTGIFFPAADTIAFSEGGVESMRIDSTGNVAIGVNSSSQKLRVYQSLTNSQCYVQVENNRTRNAAVYTKTTNGGFYTGTSIGTDVLCWQVYDDVAGERMRIDSSGNVGIGVTPSAWSTVPAIQVSTYGGLSAGGGYTRLSSNAYLSTWPTTWSYINTNTASLYEQAGGSHIWFNAASGTAGNTIAFSERMRITSSGNVLVGTTVSNTLFTVGATTQTGAEVSTYTTNASGGDSSKFSFWRNYTNGGSSPFRACYISNINWDDSFGGNNRQDLGFFTKVGTAEPVERARITGGGYFKASNSGSYQDATGSYHEFQQTANNLTLWIENSNASLNAGGVVFIDCARNTTNNTYYSLAYYNRGAEEYKFRVADSGNVTNINGSYGTISDAKLKQDIVDAGSQWDDIKGLRFRKYRLKSDVEANLDAKPLLGLVAQEAELVSPGLIEEHRDTDGEGNDLGTTTKSIKTSILYMKAVKALQEAMLRIEALETEVAALKAK